MCVCLCLHMQHMCTCVCIRRERDKDFKELSQRIVEVVKSKIYRISWQSGDSRKKLLFQFKLEGTLLTDFPLLLGRPVFSTGYMRPPILCIQSALHAYVLSFQWYPTLCDPMDCSLPVSSVHGILQQEYWSGLLCPSRGDLPDPGIKIPSLIYTCLGPVNCFTHI